MTPSTWLLGLTIDHQPEVVHEAEFNGHIYLYIIINYIYIYTAGGGGSPRGRQSGSLNWRKNSVSLW